jgi:hypothetical protein
MVFGHFRFRISEAWGHRVFFHVSKLAIVIAFWIGGMNYRTDVL